MAAASYDQLLKQVEALKMENSNLRQELEDNSNHLTKLETEASNMKEVLKQLQGSIEDEAMTSSGQIDLLERLKDHYFLLILTKKKRKKTGIMLNFRILLKE